MATLQNIFNTVRYGEEYCKFQQVKRAIEENYDEDTKIFSASGRIKNLCGCMTLNEEYEKIVNHICNKCESVEKRLYNEDVMSPQYKKIQAVSILEDCNKITAKANKRGTTKHFLLRKSLQRL